MLLVVQILTNAGFIPEPIDKVNLFSHFARPLNSQWRCLSPRLLFQRSVWVHASSWTLMANYLKASGGLADHRLSSLGQCSGLGAADELLYGRIHWSFPRASHF